MLRRLVQPLACSLALGIQPGEMGGQALRRAPAASSTSRPFWARVASAWLSVSIRSAHGCPWPEQRPADGARLMLQPGHVVHQHGHVGARGGGGIFQRPALAGEKGGIRLDRGAGVGEAAAGLLADLVDGAHVACEQRAVRRQPAAEPVEPRVERPHLRLNDSGIAAEAQRIAVAQDDEQRRDQHQRHAGKRHVARQRQQRRAAAKSRPAGQGPPAEGREREKSAHDDPPH